VTNLAALRRQLATRPPPAIYEEYLLEAVRQKELGATIYTVLILE
jgi:hypothetical protein